MPANTAKIISSLEIVRQKDPGLADTIDLHCALLKAQDQVKPVCSFGSPTAAEAEDALGQGTPLLRLRPLFFDWLDVSLQAVEVCRIVASYRPDLANSLAGVRQYFVQQDAQIAWLTIRYLNGGNLNNAINQSQLPASDLLTFILRHTLRPFLQSRLQHEASLWEGLKFKTNLWVRPICPMCGGPSDFAALVAVNSENGYGRRLLCARCDMEWGYRRNGCPFCGQVAQWTYFPDENELFRLYGCDDCHRYLKTVDWRQTFAYRSLPVARVITVGMDLAARQAGFT